MEVVLMIVSVLLITVVLLQSDKSESASNILLGASSELFAQRKEKQPLNMPNAGSIFKRGEGYITAKLIDECGLKGYRIGDAEISVLHAGFIVNKGNATAKDILNLIQYIKDKIKEKFNIDIETEIKILGED